MEERESKKEEKVSDLNERNDLMQDPSLYISDEQLMKEINAEIAEKEKLNILQEEEFAAKLRLSNSTKMKDLSKDIQNLEDKASDIGAGVKPSNKLTAHSGGVQSETGISAGNLDIELGGGDQKEKDNILYYTYFSNILGLSRYEFQEFYGTMKRSLPYAFRINSLRYIYIYI